MVALKYARNGDATIQILVVVAIVAVLVYLLVPIFSRTSTRARRSSCQGNMKECAIVLQIYANDYDGYLPSSALVSGSKKWNKKDFLTFATKRGELRPPSGTPPNTWTQVLYSHMKNKDIVFCPSDPADTTNPEAQVSYWWKLAIDKAWYGEGCSKEYRKLNDYPYEADCIILYEHMGSHFGSREGLKNGVQINCAFLDTHVKTHTIVNATSGDPVKCVANADGEPMYFNFDNDRDSAADNPPDPSVPATYVDPGRYSDRLP